MKAFLLAAALLTAIYALVLPSVAPLDLLFGALLATLLLWLFRGYLFGGRWPELPNLGGRVLVFAAFLVWLTGDVLLGTWRVALVVLRLRSFHGAGLVEVPIGERSPAALVANGLVTTLSPGSVLVDVDYDAGCLIFHVLDAEHPEQFRAGQERLFQRYLARIFP